MGRLHELTQSSERERIAGDREDWPRLMRALAKDAEIALWEARIQWLQSARELLAGLVEQSEHLYDEGVLSPDSWTTARR